MLVSLRVYDNAKANAELQKAQLVLSLQAKSSKRSRRKFFEYLNKHCAPLRDSYDDSEVDGNEDASLTKITHQIHVSKINFYVILMLVTVYTFL